jgi:hypothetical protein
VYVELKNKIAISCAVLVPYLFFLASLSVPLVALSSTNRFSLPRLHLREDTRHARPLTSSVLTIPSWPYLPKLSSCSVYCTPGVGYPTLISLDSGACDGCQPHNYGYCESGAFLFIYMLYLLIVLLATWQVSIWYSICVVSHLL